MKLRGEAHALEFLKADSEIFIRDTDWKVLHHDRVIVDSNSPSGSDSEMYQGFQLLIGKEVTSAGLHQNGDLTLRFTDDFSFVANCRKDLSEDQSNFYIVIGDREITVGSDCQPTIAVREH